MITTKQLEVLLEVYTKENLEKGLFFLVRKFFGKFHPFQGWDGVNVQNIIALLNSKKLIAKQKCWK